MGHVVDAPTWTILIPTLGQRATLFQRLMAVLLPQLEPYEGRVRVVAWWNNGEPALSAIRHQLVQDTTTDYVSFADDDDLVPEYFVAEVMAALDQWPDYVGWQTRYSSNGVDHGLVDHSLAHGGWREEKNPYRLLRDITHINPMRTDVAKMGDFRRGVRPGRPEDRPWVDQIRKTGLLQTEVYIDKIMYDYLWRRDTSAWQKPHRIDRRPAVRPTVDSSYFSWHPGSAGIEAPAMASRHTTSLRVNGGDLLQGGLLIIIPTRGRPQNMRRVIDAWKRTNAFEVASVLFAIDNDDPDRDAYLIEIADEDLALGVCVTQADRLPMALRTNAEAAVAAGLFFALGSAGDDHVPETPGWAQRYLAELRDLRAGIVYGDDGYQGVKLCTEWAMTSNIVTALGGRLVPAPVDHLYADNAVLELGKAAGCIRHLPDVKITHVHPAAGHAEAQDEGYLRVNAREKYAKDGATFKTWMKTQLPGDASLVRALGGHRVQRIIGTQHRSRLGLGKGGEIRSRPSTQLDPNRKQARRPKMSIPRRIREVRGLTSDDAMVALADMAAQVPAGRAIVELGVYLGKTALAMAWGASQGGGAHVYGVDPWELAETAFEHPVDPVYRKWPTFNSPGARSWAEWHVQALGYSSKISLVHGFSAEVGKQYGGPPVGLLFVDGDHRYDAVRADVAAWAPHLAEDAVIVFDDYESSHPDLIRAVDDMVEDQILCPVQVFHGRLAVTKIGPEFEIRGGYTDEDEDPNPGGNCAAGVPCPPFEDVTLDVTATAPIGHFLVEGRTAEEHALEGDCAVCQSATQPTAITSEGVQVVDLPEPSFVEHVLEATDPSNPLSEDTVRAARLLVQKDELEGVAAGTSIEELTLAQLKALAKHREIVLGARKDKKDLILDALRRGQ